MNGARFNARSHQWLRPRLRLRLRLRQVGRAAGRTLATECPIFRLGAKKYSTQIRSCKEPTRRPSSKGVINLRGVPVHSLGLRIKFNLNRINCEVSRGDRAQHWRVGGRHVVKSVLDVFPWRLRRCARWLNSPQPSAVTTFLPSARRKNACESPALRPASTRS